VIKVLEMREPPNKEVLKLEKGRKSLTLKEIIDFWFPYKKVGNRYIRLNRVYYILEKNGTEIITDYYDIAWNNGENSRISCYYKGYKIAEVWIKNIKMIYYVTYK